MNAVTVNECDRSRVQAQVRARPMRRPNDLRGLSGLSGRRLGKAVTTRRGLSEHVAISTFGQNFFRFP